MPLARASLFDVASENDFTLLEQDGEYFVSFGDRTGTYREFLRMILLDDRLYPDLVAGDAAASFFALMKGTSTSSSVSTPSNDIWRERCEFVPAASI